MANVGSDKRRDGSARKAAAVLGNPILSASLPPQAEAADAGPAASSEVQPLESTWDKEDGYIEMMVRFCPPASMVHSTRCVLSLRMLLLPPKKPRRAPRLEWNLAVFQERCVPPGFRPRRAASRNGIRCKPM